MNYKKIYDSLMIKARSEKRLKDEEVYYEAHHIIPKCMGGEGNYRSDPNHSNIVLLTSREHFLCHWLLAEIHTHHRGIIYAFHKMCIRVSSKKMNRYVPSSRVYEYAKRLRVSIGVSKETLEKMRIAGANISDKTRLKMRNSHLGIKLSDEHKKSISKSNLGREVKESTKEKISRSNKGKVRDEEARRKMSLAKKGKPSSFKGKTLSEEAKQKIRDKKMGKKLSNEHKEKIGSSLKGKTYNTKNKKKDL